MTVEVYNPALAAEWDRVLGECRNATFLHRRGYMDYHADHFADMSLIARDDRDRIVALLPACRCGDVLQSHGGLTYGGWLMTPRADMNVMMSVWESMTDILREQGIKKLIYSPTPYIYHKYPAEEDIYALWRAGGKLEKVLVSSVIDLAAPLGFSSTACRKVRKAARSGVAVSQTNDWAGYWSVLSERLFKAHNARPVHSLDEILLLKSRFPDSIRLYTATAGGLLLGGVVLYVTDTVAHCQYIACSDAGLEMNVLPLLFEHIIAMQVSGVRYFDFGTSNEDAGRYLNEGLIQQKASFGARAVAYNTFSIDI